VTENPGQDKTSSADSPAREEISEIMAQLSRADQIVVLKFARAIWRDRQVKADKTRQRQQKWYL
jgi:hypothetical protein